MIFKILIALFILSDPLMAADRILQGDQLVSPTNASNVRVTDYKLYDGSGEALDWTNRRCKDSSGKFSLDWNNHITWDNAEITSMDWNQRWLQDNAGFTRVNWQNGSLSDALGNQVLNFNGNLNAGRTFDLAPDVVCCDGVTNVNVNSTITNSADVINRGLTNLDLSLQFDPINNGFKIGDSTQGQFYLLNAQTSHVSSGEMGGLTGANFNLQFGDPALVITGGKANNITGIVNRLGTYDGHEINGYTGYQANGDIGGQFKTGSGFTIFNSGFNFAATSGDILNYQAFSHNSQFANNMTSSHDLSVYGNNWQFQNGFVGGVATSFSDFATMQNGSTLQGYSSININPEFQTGSTVNQNSSITNISPHGAGSFPLGVTGLNVDVSNLSAVATLDKTAASISGGKFNYGVDVAIPNASGAYVPFSSNVHATVQNGSPIANSYGFSHVLNTLFEIHDDIGDDGLGLKLGHTMVAATGTMEVDSGKTVDAYNGYLFGQAVISPSAGTINYLKGFRAAGLLPGGGSLTVNNQMAFAVESIWCSFATNCWGLYDDSGAENYVSKMAILTADKKVYSDSLLGLGDQSVMSGDIHSQIRNVHLKTDPTVYAIDAGYAGLTTDTFTDNSATAVVGIHNTSKANVASGKAIGGLAGIFNTVSRAESGDDGDVPFAFGVLTNFASGNSATKTTDLYASYFAGFHSIDSNANQIGAMYDFYAQASSIGSGAVTNRYGIVIEADSGYTKNNWLSGKTLLGGTSFSAPAETLHVLGDVTVNDGHFGIIQTTPPTPAVDANAGTSATCSMNASTDNAGIINLTTGSVAWASGIQCTITFNSTFANTPVCTLTAIDSNAATKAVVLGVYPTWNTNTFDINFTNADIGTNTYQWSYICVGGTP
jgi:hypothetical protein